MSNPSLIGAVARDSDISGPLLLGIAALLGLAAVSLAIFRVAVSGAEARSRGDRAAQLRALDEVAALGGIRSDDYAARRAALLKEF